MIRLSVNLNAVAMLRNRRKVGWPNLTHIARVVLEAGADGITVHPRPDERHIRRADVPELGKLVREGFPKAEFNIEGFPGPEFLDLVEVNRPDQATFVPDDPDQGTSDHGWDIPRHSPLLRAAIARMKGAGIRVSLFIDADRRAPGNAADVGADRVELYTGPYGASFSTPEGGRQLEMLAATAQGAAAAGLGVNAGHDLTLDNLGAFIKAVPQTI
ncbi:MAG: pyridoxine 5'-phosphate synthase, partial [Cucumibacter sp.]